MFKVWRTAPDGDGYEDELVGEYAEYPQAREKAKEVGGTIFKDEEYIVSFYEYPISLYERQCAAIGEVE